MNALVEVPSTNAAAYRASTDAANLCRDIVLATAMEIQKRRYVRVEGWQALAVAHGCAASARDVERVEGGVRAIGEVHRMSDGQLIAQAEGFVGEDEPTWYGGVTRAWKWGDKRGEKVWYDKTLDKRPDFAIRAMAQTRAISRACRSAFSHVIVMIDRDLSTIPAEEVPPGGWHDPQDDPPPDDGPDTEQHKRASPAPPTLADRAQRFLNTIAGLNTAEELEKARQLADGLLTELDVQDPEGRKFIDDVYARRLQDVTGEASHD